MRRSLRPGLLLTVSACSTVKGLPGNPPFPDKVQMPSAPFSEGQALNPTHSAFGAVYGGGDHCWVHVPDSEPMTSWRPPKTKDIACPDAMRSDPAWAACSGGTLSIVQLSPPACQCYFDGNPPPPPERVACPTLPGLGDAVIPEVR